MSSGDGRIPAELGRKGVDEWVWETGKDTPGKFPSERFRTWTRTIAPLKGRSHECRQVTEEYLTQLEKGGMRGCVKFGIIGYPGGRRVNSSVASLPRTVRLKLLSILDLFRSNE
ncbi:hypothetical protein CDAR_619441 [Caerostris darwini]|uniref:Uncharacterized protein n=1 Tax=Caerostris darwini TaxID=1538125 RepID=A0AAV4PWB6_9ARAC|nr:hypothetical protein CDAR_619441 [Caerostris darwini]